jgi:protocatechuate 3,4-dioxygenase beta subunit
VSRGALPPTGWQTVGPFFPRGFIAEADHDLTRLTATAEATARGEAIWLVGHVLEDGGRPCENALLEAWQADASGRFRHPLDLDQAKADPGFLGWGRACTDATGGYRFRTVLPADTATRPANGRRI